MVVDDDPDIRETLAALLELEGHDVVCHSNGRLALDDLQKRDRPDLILLDLMMPVMNGWQFLIVKESDPELAAIPVIAITAADPASTLEIPVRAVLRKPFGVSALRDAIGDLA